MIKKMRNALMAISICLFCSVAAKAQTSGTTTLKVVLSPLLSIVVNNANVTLNYATLTDYQNGVSVSMPSHLTVSSLLPYTINLKSNNATLAGTGTNTNTLNANLVQVQLPNTNTGLGGTLNTITALSTTNQPLITLATPTLAKSIDVQYSITAANTASGIVGKNPDTYSSTITYTISN